MDEGMVDVRGRIQEIESELFHLNETISNAQSRIERYQQTITQSEAKASELRNVIAIFKKYLLGEQEPDTKNTSEPQGESSPQRLNLTEAIQRLLDSSSGKEFTVAEVSEVLKSQGYPSKSSDFRNVVRNTMSKMGIEGRIQAREDAFGMPKKYWVIKREMLREATSQES